MFSLSQFIFWVFGTGFSIALIVCLARDEVYGVLVLAVLGLAGLAVTLVCLMTLVEWLLNLKP